ncbi:hypothetical protein ACFTSF_04185 [Kribbella sp. NPDC056951]|uniref:hypothetical protein n=1 Tax=Kribbella sp. NPDC056951 TaxID=3345978 RepID=UPI00363CE231
MATTLFPVGHYAGRRPGDDGRPTHSVRIGWRLHRLPDDVFGTWLLGHGTAETGKGPWTATDLVGAAEASGIAAARSHVAGLQELGLLTDVTRAPEEFAKKHRMDVQFVGLGNSPDHPDRFAIGLPGLGPAALVDPETYELWQWGSLAPTLWHSCQVRASVLAELDRPVEPVEALTSVLGDLRFLLAHGCAYVDLADEQ